MVEISKQCDIDMMLLIFDKANNRFKEVHTNEALIIQEVNSIIKQPNAPKYRTVFAGEIFEEAKQEDKTNLDEQ